ncbi:hypothetical protein K523DRAFT_404907 [Schizophyllum commune Tattone D]|nr:hypothetical protein K523DRAFT_404907 [Schizophyllum commune Tattone D]
MPFRRPLALILRPPCPPVPFSMLVHALVVRGTAWHEAMVEDAECRASKSGSSAGAAGRGVKRFHTRHVETVPLNTLVIDEIAPAHQVGLAGPYKRGAASSGSPKRFLPPQQQQASTLKAMMQQLEVAASLVRAAFRAPPWALGTSTLRPLVHVVLHPPEAFSLHRISRMRTSAGEGKRPSGRIVNDGQYCGYARLASGFLCCTAALPVSREVSVPAIAHLRPSAGGAADPSGASGVAMRGYIASAACALYKVCEGFHPARTHAKYGLSSATYVARQQAQQLSVTGVKQAF